MKTQPQLLLESIVPQPTSTVPEWVHEEWQKLVAKKWAIQAREEKLAEGIRKAIQFLEQGNPEQAEIWLRDTLS